MHRTVLAMLLTKETKEGFFFYISVALVDIKMWNSSSSHICQGWKKAMLECTHHLMAAYRMQTCFHPSMVLIAPHLILVTNHWFNLLP